MVEKLDNDNKSDDDYLATKREDKDNSDIEDYLDDQIDDSSSDSDVDEA